MKSVYPTVTVGEVASVKSGYAFKSKDWQTEGVPVVRIANVKNGRLEMAGCAYVSAEVAEQAGSETKEKATKC